MKTSEVCQTSEVCPKILDAPQCQKLFDTRAICCYDVEQAARGWVFPRPDERIPNARGCASPPGKISEKIGRRVALTTRKLHVRVL
jgi:hypothetical protein